MYLKGPLVILGQEQQKTSGVLASPTQPPSILLPDLVMSMGQTCWTVEAPDTGGRAAGAQLPPML